MGAGEYRVKLFRFGCFYDLFEFATKTFCSVFVTLLRDPFEGAERLIICSKASISKFGTTQPLFIGEAASLYKESGGIIIPRPKFVQETCSFNSPGSPSTHFNNFGKRPLNP